MFNENMNEIEASSCGIFTDFNFESLLEVSLAVTRSKSSLAHLFASSSSFLMTLSTVDLF
jgi:hypothetical protein